YLKALAAYESGVPFYVALPAATYDPLLSTGDQTPIELRAEREITHILGFDDEQNLVREVRIAPERSRALNYAFDVTPARYVSAYITDRGILRADELELLASAHFGRDSQAKTGD
ncbi:MAG: S-methyl-5-thioribose-1-phosphate isomerase, partial [Bacteroidia bacterium]|nr:S-methyl-5-thioribose-1-phosphate isomerase [Bacteroidia bacterium]MDW8334558.1 S-methyl-5-thioribose-1-phosphate isomerase [Bacteroidia bacterium]